MALLEGCGGLVRTKKDINKNSHIYHQYHILKVPAFQKYSTRWVFSALYLAVPDFT